MTKVVVTGIGVVSPAGVGVAPLWEAASCGHSLQERLQSSDEHTMLNKFEFASS